MLICTALKNNFISVFFQRPDPFPSRWQGQRLIGDKHTHWPLGQCMWTTEPNRFPEVFGNEVFEILTEALWKNSMSSAVAWYFLNKECGWFYIVYLLKCCLLSLSSTGMTQTDGMGREVGRGFKMGNTCKSMADSCQCMAKTTTIL